MIRLVVVAVGLALLAWWAVGERSGSSTTPRVDPIGLGEAGPALRGPERRSAQSDAPVAEAPAQGPGGVTPRGRPTHVRVIDGRGRPVVGATVVFLAKLVNAPSWEVDVQTDEAGAAQVPDVEHIRRVGVRWAGAMGEERIQGVEGEIPQEVVLSDYLMLPVRVTLDDGSPATRHGLHARMAGEIGVGVECRFDNEASALLGPYPVGSVVELRADPLGRSLGEAASARHWTSVTVVGEPIVLGAAPGLPVRVRADMDGASVRVTCPTTRRELCRGTVRRGRYESPPLVPGQEVDVHVGPVEDGRVGKVRTLPSEEWVDIPPSPGRPVLGQVTAAGPADLTGRVFARALGLSCVARIEPDGRFHFAGLPAGGCRLVAWVPGGKGAHLAGATIWSGESNPVVAVRPTVPVTFPYVEYEVRRREVCVRAREVDPETGEIVPPLYEREDVGVCFSRWATKYDLLLPASLGLVHREDVWVLPCGGAKWVRAAQGVDRGGLIGGQVQVGGAGPWPISREGSFDTTEGFVFDTGPILCVVEGAP